MRIPLGEISGILLVPMLPINATEECGAPSESDKCDRNFRSYVFAKTPRATRHFSSFPWISIQGLSATTNNCFRRASRIAPNTRLVVSGRRKMINTTGVSIDILLHLKQNVTFRKLICDFITTSKMLFYLFAIISFYKNIRRTISSQI